MYGMFIVDDNPLERNGIAGLIDWASLGVKVLGVYRNGKHAMEHIEELQPDIILSDVQMPVMNGLELGKSALAWHPGIKLIFMSSYDDFVFAKSAIHLNAVDYLLKPVKKNELQNVVMQAIQHLNEVDHLEQERNKMVEQINQALPLYREQFFRELLFGYLKNKDEIRNRMELLHIQLNNQGHFWVIDFQVMERNISPTSVPENYFTSYYIQTLLEKIKLTIAINLYMVPVSDKQFVFVFNSLEKESGPYQNSLVIDCIIEIKEKIEQVLNLTTKVGVSKASDSLEDLPLLYGQSVKAVETKYYSEESHSIIQYEEIEELVVPIEDMIDYKHLYQEVKELISAVEGLEFQRFFDKYLNPKQKNFSENYMKSFLLYIKNITQLMLVEAKQSVTLLEEGFPEELTIHQASTVTEIKLWIEQLCRSIREQLYADHKTHYEQIVEQVKEIIKLRYSESLTVNDIAASIYLSPSHANNIFKAKTGNTIFDYLVDYRIEVAKTLLKQASSRIYLVAEKVGYTNKSHFCLLFKKYTGLTPSEYKNQ